MRDFIFILVLATLGFLAFYHYRLEAWTPFFIDSVLAAFALYSWKPWIR